MSIYTRLGDDGTTDSLSGRTGKDSALIWVYGSIDELMAFLGMSIAFIEDDKCNDIKDEMHDIINELSSLCAEVSEASGYVNHFGSDELIMRLEGLIDKHSVEVGRLTGFILPCGHRVAAVIHAARTVARRAERYMTELGKEQGINSNCMGYINRLSDYLFMVARVVNERYNIVEEKVGI